MRAPVGSSGEGEVDAHRMTISLGVAMLDELALPGPAAIVAAADLAMYEAKSAGGDGYAFFAAAARPAATRPLAA
jgi:GGDEF domain-containing protein